VDSGSKSGYEVSVTLRIRPLFAWNKCNPARERAFSRGRNASAEARNPDSLGRRRVRRCQQMVDPGWFELAQVARDQPLEGRPIGKEVLAPLAPELDLESASHASDDGRIGQVEWRLPSWRG
jgi:hypothetical protein